MKSKFLKTLGSSYGLSLKSKKLFLNSRNQVKLVITFAKGDLKDLGKGLSLSKLATLGAGRLFWTEKKNYQGEVSVRLEVNLKSEGYLLIEKCLGLGMLEEGSWPSRGCYSFPVSLKDFLPSLVRREVFATHKFKNVSVYIYSI